MFKFYCYICNFRYCVWTPLTRGEESGDCHCDRVTEDECNTCRGSFVHAFSSKLQTWWPSNIERLGRSSEVYIRYQYGGYLFTRSRAHCYTMCERGINTFSQLNCASGIHKFDTLLGHDEVFVCEDTGFGGISPIRPYAISSKHISVYEQCLAAFVPYFK